MARMPEGLPEDARRPIPPRAILSALKFASVLGGVATAVGLAEGAKRGRFAWEALLYGGAAALVLWPIVLFAIAVMQAHHEPDQRHRDGIS